MKHGEVRIIGGQWRGRKLKFPALPGLRPTTDPIRETLFNWLAPYLDGAHCLDLFAGSGALGIEALSRGAAHVVFIDQNPKIVTYLKEQLNLLNTAQAEVYRVKIPSELFLNPPRTKFDIIFLDAPFHQNFIAPCCQWLECQNWIAEQALIYIEAEATLSPLPLPEQWEIIRSKSSGQVGYYLVRRGTVLQTAK